MAEDRMLSDEILLGLIKKNSGGGGGGTTNYNQLENKPQIGGVTLSGNKSASDLGLADDTTVQGILDGQTIDSFGDVETALENLPIASANTKGMVKVGTDMTINNNGELSPVVNIEIPASQYTFSLSDGYLTVYKTTDGITETVGTYYWNAIHSSGGQNIDDVFIIKYPISKWNIQLLTNTVEHDSGYVYEFAYEGPAPSAITMLPSIDSKGLSVFANNLLDGQSIDSFADVETALSGKQNTLTFDDTPTDGSNNPVKSNGIYDALALKQNATDNSLETTDKTIVGAINEHEGDIDSLKNGLTNLADDVKLNTQDLTTPSRTKNLSLMTVDGLKKINTDGTWTGNSYAINNSIIDVLTDADWNVTGIKLNGTFNNTTLFYFDLVSLNGSYIINGCPSGGSATSYRLDLRAYDDGVMATDIGDGANTGNISIQARCVIRIENGTVCNNIIFKPMIRLASVSDPTFAPYIPSVESRIEAVESGVDLSTSIIAGEHVTIDTTTSYVIKEGGIVVCMLSITANQDLSINDEILITNMPKPSRVRLVQIVYGSKQFQCSITASGIFKFAYSDSTLQSGEKAKMSFVYPL